MAGCYFLSSFVERRALPLLLLFVLSIATPSSRLCSSLLRPALSLLYDRRCRSLRWVVGGNGSSVGERSVMAGKGCSTWAPGRRQMSYCSSYNDLCSVVLSLTACPLCSFLTKQCGKLI
ncbi:hypothetical protein OPV22_015733 [Ensete ventricosum]|uniref:Secreted protein n=1 Tax=Ensete ventricosum TaxID=4639 RepID=A0AAV8RB32_ENSVE|nr:hypothetical protein OPV22_015733 [Ensete ventricosum]